MFRFGAAAPPGNYVFTFLLRLLDTPQAPGSYPPRWC